MLKKGNQRNWDPRAIFSIITALRHRTCLHVLGSINSLYWEWSSYLFNGESLLWWVYKTPTIRLMTIFYDMEIIPHHKRTIFWTSMKHVLGYFSVIPPNWQKLRQSCVPIILYLSYLRLVVVYKYERVVCSLLLETSLAEVWAMQLICCLYSYLYIYIYMIYV